MGAKLTRDGLVMFILCVHLTGLMVPMVSMRVFLDELQLK